MNFWHYIIGEFELLINDSSDFYRFLQTKKELRRKINSINLLVRYDFLKTKLSFEKVLVDGNYNEGVQDFIKQFNQQNKSIKNRVDLRSFLNAIIEEL